MTVHREKEELLMELREIWEIHSSELNSAIFFSLKPTKFSKIPEEGEEGSQETQEVSYTREVTAEEGEKTSLMEGKWVKRKISKI